MQHPTPHREVSSFHVEQGNNPNPEHPPFEADRVRVALVPAQKHRNKK